LFTVPSFHYNQKESTITRAEHKETGKGRRINEMEKKKKEKEKEKEKSSPNKTIIWDFFFCVSSFLFSFFATICFNLNFRNNISFAL